MQHVETIENVSFEFFTVLDDTFCNSTPLKFTCIADNLRNPNRTVKLVSLLLMHLTLQTRCSSIFFIASIPVGTRSQSTMSFRASNLDRFRSPRATISKHQNYKPRAETVLQTSTDANERDFSRYLGNQHPLRIIFIGHNPSVASWTVAAPYAHKSNRFWPLMYESGLVPDIRLAKAQFYKELPGKFGLGFADLFVTSGSDASKVNEGEGDSLRRDVMRRIMIGTGNVAPRILCCVSKIVAKKLLHGWNGDYGKTGRGRDWGLEEMKESEVWVLPSSSGRAGIKKEMRLKPYKELAEYVVDMPWEVEKPNLDEIK